jgi:hypothetical protein
MPTRVVPFKSFTTTKQPLANMLRGALYNLSAQLQKPSTQGIIDSASAPRGQKKGDTTIRYTPTGAIEVSLYDSRGVPATSIIAADANSNVSFQTGVVPPALVNFPTDGSNGQYYDTAAQKLYIVRNYQGALIYPNFVSISGTITDTQHGDRSTTTTVMHKFPQISGTITDTQHGNRGNGSLHDVADGSNNGFLSSTFFTLLNGATASATASTLVKRNGSGGANFAGTLTTATIDASDVIGTSEHYEVDGMQVVKEQQPAIAGADGTLADATTKINLIIGRLRAHGLIAT